MRARVGISLCGAVALVVLARAAAYYARTDALALALVVTMTVALVGATAELLARVGRVDRLGRELAALPRPATALAVDGSSDALRPLLRARMAHAAGSLGSAPLAGYVVGLLVMLGLLGTFLGLFETLRGAREALTSSGDVEGLRASLAAPMQGLTRSFGTSAAGVSASAMLGLASALARQAEARFGQALAAYATDALAPLTIEGRQLEALERLARHGEAFPRAVNALEAAAARLTSLEASWGAAHAEASSQTTKAIRDAAESVRRDLERAVAQAGTAAEQALSPLVARAVEGSVEAARKHVLDVGAKLAEDLAARRADEAAHARKRDEAFARIAVAEESRAKTLASLWTEATRALDASVAAADARGSARDAAFAKTAEEVASAARAAVDAAGERLERAVEGTVATARKHVLELAASLDADRAARRGDEASHAQARDEALARIVAAEETRAQTLAALWSDATRALEASVAATDARGEAREATFARTAGEIASAAQAAVESAGERLERAVEGTVTTARKHVLDVAASLDADLAARRADEASHAKARDEALAKIAASEESRAKTLASLWTDATRTIESSVAATDARGEARDAAFAKTAGEIANAARAAVESAGERLEQADARAVAQAKQLTAVLAAIDARTEATAGLAGEQRAAVDGLLKAAATRAEALDVQARAGHAALVAEVQRGMEAHAARATKLEEDVGAALALHAEQLVAALGSHSEERAAELDAVATSVRDAATGVQAGGAELAAVAEMFAAAVDRHREGAAEWLAALGTVEGAIARGAEDVAGGALNEQLERARELFDTQLQFHRELLVQLRGVHVATATASESRRELPRPDRQDEDAPA